MLNTNGNINNSITLNVMSSPNINSLNSENLIGPSLSSKIEKFIQESQGVTIPSIVFEYLSKEDKDFEYKDLKNFYEQFGDIDEFELNGKISVVLFKSFFAANVCREFLSNEHNFKDNLKKDFKVKWFEIDKDSELIDQKLLEKFQKIDEKNKFYLNLNLKNLKNGKNKNKQSNNNNDLDINDNSNNEMGMKINFNINMNNVNNVNLNNNINGFSNINGNNINGFYNGKGNNININSQIMNNNQTDLQNLFNNLQIANNINNKFPINNINNINTINNINNFNNNIITNNSYINQNNHNNQNSIIINHNSINQNNNINNSNIGKYICKYEILIPNEKDFRIAKRIIGSKGNNMKKIVDLVQGIKLRLRGKGSGFKEGPKNKESDEPLHLCISSKNIEEMNRACLLINNLLEKIYEDYKIYCYKNGLNPVPQIAIKQDMIFSYRKNSH
jgi:hypothetical protein